MVPPTMEKGDQMDRGGVGSWRGRRLRALSGGVVLAAALAASAIVASSASATPFPPIDSGGGSGQVTSSHTLFGPFGPPWAAEFLFASTGSYSGAFTGTYSEQATEVYDYLDGSGTVTGQGTLSGKFGTSCAVNNQLVTVSESGNSLGYHGVLQSSGPVPLTFHFEGSGSWFEWSGTWDC